MKSEFIQRPKILPVPVIPDLPEVYQIEVASVCNFGCIMCPRQFFPRKDKAALINPDLVKKIVDEGDLEASYFVELQMNGEPLLHPYLSNIIDIVKTANVKVGLSTNGSLIHEQMEALQKLDYITVSVDSFSNYEKIRKGGNFHRLIRNIERLAIAVEGTSTVIDIQVLELTGWEEELKIIKEYFAPYNVSVRTYPNCYLPYFFKYKLPTSTELCINPWLSVSIACNGNVTACCISPGDDIQLGNLKNQTLKEVWAGEEVRKLREEHITRNYRPVCAKCYMRGPCLFHMKLFFDAIRDRKNG